ncbi:MAG TPA: hypothetical protein VIM61_00560 [Chthoniobacterales bacterium]
MNAASATVRARRALTLPPAEPLSEREVTQFVLEALIREATAFGNAGTNDFAVSIRFDLQSPMISIKSAFNVRNFHGPADLAEWLVARCNPKSSQP